MYWRLLKEVTKNAKWLKKERERESEKDTEPMNLYLTKNTWSYESYPRIVSQQSELFTIITTESA